MTNTENIDELFESSSIVINNCKSLTNLIQLSVEKIIESFENGNKLLIFGNGGSAADAQHMSAEFIGRYLLERKSLPAIALTTDSSILTAIGNDYNFDQIFSRQCESIVKKGDVIFAISTSGQSKNVIGGIDIAKSKGAFIISLTGEDGKLMKEKSDICLEVPSNSTPRIQEGHRIVIHIICQLVEQDFYQKNSS
ncbi:Phosphoheptose isomerase protein [Marine Group I thaumarchaeote SCGC AAA799-B03]|uniref:Probable phosphoheptose isomerase n=1 Tax=Marine Group I thaumarchaeote SCGC AAA799-B03 TaxID=1502289 RepID=A0A087S6M1_9ARCH|nr:Phosphoheptose isomerase protein [Marine Group I thaumarchaeote SCGC AAA799-B03]